LTQSHDSEQVASNPIVKKYNKPLIDDDSNEEQDDNQQSTYHEPIGPTLINKIHYAINHYTLFISVI
jgi:hypothetical protein